MSGRLPGMAFGIGTHKTVSVCTPLQVAEKVMEHPQALVPASSRFMNVLDRAVFSRLVKSIGKLFRHARCFGRGSVCVSAI